MAQNTPESSGYAPSANKFSALESRLKQDWHPDELAQHWTLSTDERDLLGNKTGATRLGFAVLLKFFQLEGHFPGAREEIAASIVSHLAIQTGVPREAFLINDEGWSERTERHRRAQIREHCGFRAFHAEDEPVFIQCLSERVASSQSGCGRVSANGVRAFARAAP